MPKHRLLGERNPADIVHQQRYLPSDSNTKVFIQLRAHDMFLDKYVIPGKSVDHLS